MQKVQKKVVLYADINFTIINKTIILAILWNIDIWVRKLAQYVLGSDENKFGPALTTASPIRPFVIPNFSTRDKFHSFHDNSLKFSKLCTFLGFSLMLS